MDGIRDWFVRGRGRFVRQPRSVERSHIVLCFGGNQQRALFSADERVGAERLTACGWLVGRPAGSWVVCRVPLEDQAWLYWLSDRSRCRVLLTLPFVASRIANPRASEQDGAVLEEREERRY